MIAVTDVVYAGKCIRVQGSITACDEITNVNAVARIGVLFVNDRHALANTVIAKPARSVDARHAQDHYRASAAIGPRPQRFLGRDATGRTL